MVQNEVLLFSVAFKFIAMMIGILGNVTVIFYVIFINTEKTAASYLVGNLALADLLVCLTFYPIWIVEFVRTLLNTDSDQDLFCKLSRSTIWALFFASVATLLAITVDRYIYFVKPLKYPLIVTRRNVFVTISGIWFTSGFSVTLHVHYNMKASDGLRTYCETSNDFFLPMNIFVAYVPLMLILLLNIQILNIARKQRKRIFAEAIVTTVDNLNGNSSKRLADALRFHIGLKAAKTFGIIVLVLVCCVLIPSVIGLRIELSCSDSCRQMWFVVFQYEFFGINSIVNAFIYGIRHNKYRKACKKILVKILCCL